ncbi:MAG: multicopper oxidase domain-containing protein [Lewinellaceae bacterium]|nr:multicopper oxidase domain-containing protein [Lewinellaceae bacterium]
MRTQSSITSKPANSAGTPRRVKPVPARGFNRQVPGPILKARKGDTFVVRVRNNGMMAGFEVIDGSEPALAALPGVPETGRHPYLGDAVCLLVQRRLSCSPVMGMTVTEERLKQRGYHSFKDYYHHVRPKMPAP